MRRKSDSFVKWQQMNLYSYLECDGCENGMIIIRCSRILRKGQNTRRSSNCLEQWFPTSFCSRTPKQKKTRVPFCDRALLSCFIENLSVILELAYPLRFFTYPWGYAYPRLRTAGLEIRWVPCNLIQLYYLKWMLGWSWKANGQYEKNKAIKNQPETAKKL